MCFRGSSKNWRIGWPVFLFPEVPEIQYVRIRQRGVNSPFPKDLSPLINTILPLFHACLAALQSDYKIVVAIWTAHQLGGAVRCRYLNNFLCGYVNGFFRMFYENSKCQNGKNKTKLCFGILGCLKQRATKSSITEMQVHRRMLKSQRGSCQLLLCRYEILLTVITAWRTNRRVFFALILLLTALACSHLHVCVRVWKVGKCTRKQGSPTGACLSFKPWERALLR